jgi:hypothetical protein
MWRPVKNVYLLRNLIKKCSKVPLLLKNYIKNVEQLSYPKSGTLKEQRAQVPPFLHHLSIEGPLI